MTRRWTATAATAAATIVAGLAASAPAVAQGPVAGDRPPPFPCVSTLDLNECVNYAFDFAQGGVEAVRQIYNETGRKYVCDVHWIVTGEYCTDPAAVVRR